MTVKVKIVSKRDYPELRKIEDRLDVVELRLVAESEDVRKAREYSKVKVGLEPDIIIAVGGDATFLRRANEEPIDPILTVRGGEKDSLGWHADFALDKIDQALYDLEHGLYEVVGFRQLETEFEDRRYYAINDVYINRVGPTIHFKVYCINGEERELIYPRDLKADGIVIAGEYGSTAYNLTAGGPMLYSVDALVATPLYAMKFGKPVITKNGFCIEMTKNTALLQYDGYSIGEISPGDSFTVRHSDRRICVVKLKNLKESLASKLDRLDKY